MLADHDTSIAALVKKVTEVMRLFVILMLAIHLGGSLEAIASDGGPEVLRVNGLYLGMNIDEGAKIITKFITPEIGKKLGGGEPLEITKIPPFDPCNYGFGYFPYGCPKIFLQSDCSKGKKVHRIDIHNDLANKMFDAGLLSQEEFVKAFENRHNITMEHRKRMNKPDDSLVDLWEFKSPHGYKVTIDQGHSVFIHELLKK